MDNMEYYSETYFVAIISSNLLPLEEIFGKF